MNNMKYVKPFSLFESEMNESVKVAPEKVLNKEAKKAIETEIAKLSDEDKEALKADMVKLAAKLKIDRIEDLQDVKKVGDALLVSGMVKESFDLDFNLGVNEASLADYVAKAKTWWEKSKKSVYDTMVKLGAGKLAGGVITMAIGSEYMPNADFLPHNVSVEPNLAIILGGTAAAIGLISLLVGLSGTGKLSDAASGAASGRR